VVAHSEENDMSDHVDACFTEATQPAAHSADCSSEQMAEARYLKTLDDLLADAAEHKRMQLLADALAFTVGRIAVGCGMAATGDVLRRLGGHICALETRRQAAEEAQLARQEGRLPN
jgi:hypothetical protein